MIRKVFKWIGRGLLAIIIFGLIGYLANKTYMDRYFRMAGSQMMGKSQEASWYDPVDQVPGAKDQPLPFADDDERGVAPDAIKSAEDYAGAMRTQGLLVWQGGKLQSAKYYGDFTRTKLIASKSMAKMVSGIVIGRAIQQGFIKSLDQPVSDFITEWKGTPKATSTIREFLQNSSGISRFDYSNNLPWSQTMREYLGEHHDDLLITETEYQYKPGTEYDYSMITSDMLAIIVERATKQRYADYVGKALLQPIGAQGGTVYINRPGGLAHTGCCLMLPAESFVRIGMLLINNGKWEGQQILPESWMKETLTPSPANKHWGLHMWIGEPWEKRRRVFPARSQPVGTLHSEPYLAKDIFLFDGSGNQAMWMSPSKQLIVLRFGPTPRPKTGEWDNSVLPNTILRGMGVK
jgi:CubicO group peptidase (beta-lactamase class C family)